MESFGELAGNEISAGARLLRLEEPRERTHPFNQERGVAPVGAVRDPCRQVRPHSPDQLVVCIRVEGRIVGGNGAGAV